MFVFVNDIGSSECNYIRKYYAQVHEGTWPCPSRDHAYGLLVRNLHNDLSTYPLWYMEEMQTHLYCQRDVNMNTSLETRVHPKTITKQKVYSLAHILHNTEQSIPG